METDTRKWSKYKPTDTAIRVEKPGKRVGTFSPMRKSLQYLRDLGYHVEIVEHYVSQAKIRRDLFGMFDILAVGGGQTIAVQTTTSGHVSERRKKILENPLHLVLKECGWVLEVHGWNRGDLKKATL